MSPLRPAGGEGREGWAEGRWRCVGGPRGLGAPAEAQGPGPKAPGTARHLSGSQQGQAGPEWLCCQKQCVLLSWDSELNPRFISAAPGTSHRRRVPGPPPLLPSSWEEPSKISRSYTWASCGVPEGLPGQFVPSNFLSAKAPREGACYPSFTSRCCFNLRNPDFEPFIGHWKKDLL